MTHRFGAQVAIVTGAAAGFGLAVASGLAAEGARVVMVDRAAAELERQARTIPGAVPVVADVSDEEQVDGFVARTVQEHGRVDLFFNNAGIEGRMAPITEQSIEDFDRVIAVNVRGVFLGLRAVLRVMKAQSAGAIVNTASVGGFRGGALTSPYTASKHAVIGLTRCAALEAGPHGVRVNCVAPGWIDTRMTRAIAEQIEPEDAAGHFERVAAGMPMRRMGRPAEVANLVLWLLSAEASYVSGSTHVIDGARTA